MNHKQRRFRPTLFLMFAIAGSAIGSACTPEQIPPVSDAAVDASASTTDAALPRADSGTPSADGAIALDGGRPESDDASASDAALAPDGAAPRRCDPTALFCEDFESASARVPTCRAGQATLSKVDPLSDTTSLLLTGSEETACFHSEALPRTDANNLWVRAEIRADDFAMSPIDLGRAGAILHLSPDNRTWVSFEYDEAVSGLHVFPPTFPLANEGRPPITLGGSVRPSQKTCVELHIHVGENASIDAYVDGVLRGTLDQLDLRIPEGLRLSFGGSLTRVSETSRLTIDDVRVGTERLPCD